MNGRLDYPENQNQEIKVRVPRIYGLNANERINVKLVHELLRFACKVYSLLQKRAQLVFER